MRASEAEAVVHATGSSVFSGTSDTGSVSTYSVSNYQSLLSMTSNDKVEAGVRVGMIHPQNVKKPSLIILKGKLGLPEGFGPLKPYQRIQAKLDVENALNLDYNSEESEVAPILLTSDALSKLSISTTKSEKEKKTVLKSKFKFRGGRLGKVKEGVEENSEEGYDNNDDMISDDDDDDDDGDYEEEETETVNTTASIVRLRGETPEQRKTRKNLVRTSLLFLIICDSLHFSKYFIHSSCVHRYNCFNEFH